MQAVAFAQKDVALEAHLGVGLLAHTSPTRSMAPTGGGETRVPTLSPTLHDLDRRIADLGDFATGPLVPSASRRSVAVLLDAMQIFDIINVVAPDRFQRPADMKVTKGA